VKVAIVGSTASGKSTLAMAAAAEVATTQLIAVDSMQVYRGMDIGTAKPTADDRSRVTHYGLDLADPIEDFTVVRFTDAYDAAIGSIGTSGPALLVAGTGLYLRAILDRFEPPAQWPELQATFDADPDLAGLYSKLIELDPVSAGRIDGGNRRRIVRALEVCVGSGLPFSSFGPGMTVYPPIDTVQIGLRWTRDALRARVDERVDRMMAAGFLDEVAQLTRDRMSRTAQQALGYRELLDHLDGLLPLPETIETIKLRTRQFAVRQERWFRRDPRIRWIDVTSDPLEALEPVIAALDATCS
jgi:tRNA dimethylallyltransferase